MGTQVRKYFSIKAGFICYDTQGPNYRYGDSGQKYFWGTLLTKPGIVVSRLIDLEYSCKLVG